MGRYTIPNLERLRYMHKVQRYIRNEGYMPNAVT